MLASWGPLQFEVYPLNYHEMDHMTQSDWAKKEIAGSPYYREWVGEGDEELYIRGRIFPYSLRGKGLHSLDVMEQMRRAQLIEYIMLGDGRGLGWYLIEKLVRKHTNIVETGIGGKIEFETVFVRHPVPDARDHFSELYSFLV